MVLVVEGWVVAVVPAAEPPVDADPWLIMVVVVAGAVGGEPPVVVAGAVDPVGGMPPIPMGPPPEPKLKVVEVPGGLVEVPGGLAPAGPVVPPGPPRVEGSCMRRGSVTVVRAAVVVLVSASAGGAAWAPSVGFEPPAGPPTATIGSSRADTCAPAVRLHTHKDKPATTSRSAVTPRADAILFVEITLFLRSQDSRKSTDLQSV
ncbi:MAG: hypothetical protein Kow00122_11900 [Thermoleophilia bacterium]